MKKTVRMKKTVFRYVSFALMVSVLLLSPQVARADVFGASSGGNTEAHSCSADVWFIVVPVSLDVDKDDIITIHFNYFWYDNRSANSPLAVHYFKVNYTWETSSGDEDLSQNTTGGNAAGSSALVLKTDQVDEYGTLGITWFASITVTSPYCFDSDTKVHSIGLV